MSLRAAIGALAATIQSANGQLMTVKRYGFTTVDVSMIPARQLDEYIDTDGSVSTFQSHDWIVTADDYVINSAVTLPEQGDILIDSDSQKYQVYHPTAEQPYRFTSPSRKMLRIHSRPYDFP